MTNQFSQDDIEIIISTMNKTSLDFLIPMFPNNPFSDFSILVINQTTALNQLVSTFDSVRIINSSENGLSKSRNLGLKNATKPILILTDDDVIFDSNFQKTVVNAFNIYTEIDVFQFKVQTSDKKFIKKYPSQFCESLSTLELLNSMSIELVFKKKVIDEKSVLYDEHFGLGAAFEIGEETSLLLDLNKKMAKIGFIPQVLCFHDEQHSATKFTKEQLYYYSGAFFYRNFGSVAKGWLLLKLFFDLKQRRIAFSMLSKLYKQAILGKNEYKKIGN